MLHNYEYLCTLSMEGKEMNKWLLSIGTFILSLFVYNFQFGLTFSFLFLILLGMHEIGHYTVAKICKLHCSVPIFIPYVGALITLKENPPKYKDAYIGLGGPLFGIISCVVFQLIVYLMNIHNPQITKVIVTIYFVNLINMIPFHPLDGGRITVLLNKNIRYVGLVLLIALNVLVKNPILVVMSVLLYYQNRSFFKNEKKRNYSDLMTYKSLISNGHPFDKFVCTSSYFALIAISFVGMGFSAILK
jgi:Zn-dependent protease